MPKTPSIPAWVDDILVPADKLEVHQRGWRHKAVSVFVVRDRKILMQRRAMSKYHTPGLWANTCCTHPLWDEAPSTCAIRRLNQELGITGLVPEYRHQLEYRAAVGNGLTEHEVVDVFVAHTDQDITIAPHPDEVMDTRWVAYHDLLAEIADHPDRFTPWLKIYLHTHAETIFAGDLF